MMNIVLDAIAVVFTVFIFTIIFMIKNHHRHNEYIKCPKCGNSFNWQYFLMDDRCPNCHTVIEKLK